MDLHFVRTGEYVAKQRAFVLVKTPLLSCFVLSLFCVVQIVVATFTFLLVQVLLIKEGGRREAIELIAFSSWASGFAAGIPIWMTVLIFLFLQAR